MKYIIGSKELELQNCTDTDEIVVVESEVEYKRVEENGTDTIYMSLGLLNRLVDFDLYDNKYAYLMLFAYQIDSTLIGTLFPVEFHIVDKREKLKKYLNYVIENKQFNFNEDITVNGDCCSKLVYHVAYNAFILKNNSPIITEEQKDIIQRIHDGLMPIKYLEEIKKIIKEE